MIHPAREIPFGELQKGLAVAKAARHVYEQVSHDGLRLYCYTNACVYDNGWNAFTTLARGLIVDPARECVVATPFPKFFNIGEHGRAIPDLPFEVFEKLDGSLIVLFWHNDRWRTATKGSFTSSQADWASEWLAARDLAALDKSVTYLAEAIYPENRIVIRYDDKGLVLLAAYAGDGSELSYDALSATAERLGWTIARRHQFASMSDLVAHAKTLPATEEGFVLRFANGLRLKLKGDEYRRIHAMISRVTPIATWKAMKAGDDLEAIRRVLPEEFWSDFDRINELLGEQLAALLARIERDAASVAHLSDKDVGLRLKDFDETIRPFIFAHRKQGGQLMSGRSREAVFRAMRPTGNALPGYTPSYAMTRLLEEDS